MAQSHKKKGARKENERTLFWGETFIFHPFSMPNCLLSFLSVSFFMPVGGKFFWFNFYDIYCDNYNVFCQYHLR